MLSVIYSQAGGEFYRKSGLGDYQWVCSMVFPLGSEEMDQEELETVLLQKSWKLPTSSREQSLW